MFPYFSIALLCLDPRESEGKPMQNWGKPQKDWFVSDAHRSWSRCAESTRPEHTRTVDGRGFAEFWHNCRSPVSLGYLPLDVYQGGPGPSPRLLEAVSPIFAKVFWGSRGKPYQKKNNVCLDLKCWFVVFCYFLFIGKILAFNCTRGGG